VNQRQRLIVPFLFDKPPPADQRGGMEVFHRDCFVEDANGAIQPLAITFFAPTTKDGDEYWAHAHIACTFFEKNVYGAGSDAAQAFFSLPIVVVSYLIGQRRFGFEAYWFEKGDLDYADFWTYRMPPTEAT
jgi:hypothetical protein